MAQLLKDEDIEKIENDLILLKSRHADLIIKLFKIKDSLGNEKAKEFLTHGVARRLKVIRRCVENIYSIFPVRREELLCDDELSDVDINLHAFFINIFGLLDNIAWVVAHEKGVAETIDRVNIGLYLNKFQRYLDDEFKEYLNSDRMKNWHNKYLKNYRDALSHRIPLYVPPKNVNPEQVEQIKILSKETEDALTCENYDEMLKLQEQIDNIGDPSPYFTHSFSESGQKIMLLHAQVITDFGTVEDVIANFCVIFEHKEE